MTMHSPQIIMFVLLLLSLGVSIGTHGKPRKPTNAGAALIAVLIEVGLLWWGGFWG
jgi:hypothetical protein